MVPLLAGWAKREMPAGWGLQGPNGVPWLSNSPVAQRRAYSRKSGSGLVLRLDRANVPSGNRHGDLARSDRQQSLDCPGGVGEVEVGVAVHGQTGVAKAHELLGHAGDHAGLAQQRGEVWRFTQPEND